MPVSPSPDYEPLLDNYSEETKSPLPPSHDPKRPRRPTPTLRELIAAPSLFFALSCLVALSISAVNISLLSTRDAFTTYAAARHPLRTPSIYPGLDSVKWDTPRCRNRTIYPRAYSQLQAANPTPSRVWAPRDEVLFSFGGEISAQVIFDIGDFGLENCTLSFHATLPTTSVYSSTHASPTAAHVAHSHIGSTKVRKGYMDSTTSMRTPLASALEVYALSTGFSKDRLLLDVLPISAFATSGGEVTTRPFWCPSGRELRVHAECRGDCQIAFGLQGMTATTSTRVSVNKTGFRIAQHEHVSCISG